MNSVQIIGRLTADPELRFTGGGTPVCTIRLAVPGSYRKDGAEPDPIFINVVTYGAQGEAVAEHMTKGRQVAVTGQLDYREWTTDDVRHSMHQITARQVQFLGTAPKDAAAPEAPAGEDYGDEPF